jgi:hypothetical protein
MTGSFLAVLQTHIVTNTTENIQMQDKKYSKVKYILLELAAHVKVKGVTGLAEYLEVPKNNLYSWIQREKIADIAAIIKKIPNARIEWLETGEGDMFTDMVASPAPPEWDATKSNSDDDRLAFIQNTILNGMKFLSVEDQEQIAQMVIQMAAKSMGRKSAP